MLRQISSDLSTAGTEVSGSASNLSVRPDAGQSSGEVAASLSTLAAAYDRSDQNTQGNLSGPGGASR